ncbi:MAG: peptidoglycan DD-metalloendopeptidase family protein [Candidatus Polarisedimenticolaceae bacterium]|nr:peptidoglycan DD-metalloendopeptidase family protein [Candidatus Polarisedimenticolaceae bacterium]
MNFILFTGFRNRTGTVKLSLGLVMSGLLLLLGVVSAGIGWAGYKMGQQHAEAAAVVDPADLMLQAALADQRSAIAEAREQTQQHLDALALRLGQMQSHIMRLDALGERLTKVGMLDEDEFNFSAAPPIGGLDASSTSESLALDELLTDLQRMSQLIDDREHKLNFMEELIMNRRLQQEIYPAGRPIKKGWISSHFGYRKDPFTGKKAFHYGVDFAGKKGADVFSVAAGMVSKAGKQSGYGYLVEINHGNGYTTRYAHNGEILVKPGDRVAKAQVIAKMGSTGRSTGPHVHFEVLQDGKKVNPWKYLRKSAAKTANLKKRSG